MLPAPTPGPIQKVTLFINEGNTGWTETYYASSNSPSNYIQVTSGGALSSTCSAYKLCAVRAPMMPATCYIAAIRAAMMGSFRKSLLWVFAPSTFQGTYVQAGQTPSNAPWYPPLIASTIQEYPAVPFAALLERFYTNGLQNKALYLGGIPLGIVGPSMSYTPTSQWNNVLGPFETAIKSIYQVVSRPSKLLATAITSLTFDSTGRIAYVTPTLGSPLGTVGPIVVTGIKGSLSAWNRVWPGTVITLGGGPVIQLGPARRALPTTPTWVVGMGGAIQGDALTNASITVADDERIVEHKRGLPFGRPHGRRLLAPSPA